MIRRISGRLSNAGRDCLQAAIVINSFYVNSDPEYNDSKIVHLVLSFVCWLYKLDQYDVFPLLAAVQIFKNQGVTHKSFPVNRAIAIEA